MNTKVLTLAFCSLLATTAVSVRALPNLQLDILNGTYNTTDETTYATAPQFTLRALLNNPPLNSSGLTEKYYISAAFEPLLSQSDPAPNVGTFTFGPAGGTSTTYSTSSSGIYYGKPPVDVADTSSGNLAPHGEFPTYYAEIPFYFDSSKTVGAYNTADGTTANGTLYYSDFNVNVSGLLSPSYSIHFDLYDETVKKASKDSTITYTVDDFAPFSHDAQSGPTTVPSVPDGGATVLLLGMGLTGLVAARRFLRR